MQHADVLLTDDELRIKDLVRDLEEHTGINKEMKDDLKAKKSMGNLIRKPVAKLKREEQ